MVYESEPLLSYPKLSNCSYSVKLITPLPRLFLRLIYHVLIPPAHHPDRPWHPLRLLSQCIYRPASHPLLYGRLPPLDVYSDGVDPRRFHILLYRWILSLSACPTFRYHPRDPSHRPMVKLRQDLNHIPSHPPTLASID